MNTFRQLPGQMSLAFRRGDDFSATVDFDISLSGYTVSSSVTSLVTGSPVIPLTTSVFDAATGKVSISLTDTQTVSLPHGTYGWQLGWVAPGDVKRTALTGVVEVTQ